MFPNPQEALPQPPGPSVEQYRKLAKDLVKACRAEGPDGIRNWTSAFVQNLVQLSSLEISPNLPVEVSRWTNEVTEFATKTLLQGARTCALTSAQFVIARSFGFTSWPRLVKHLEEMAHRRSPVSEFEAAADAIVCGDLKTLKELLARNPNLTQQRSTREHRATLLHYTSANGVEGYRQKTPQNIVEIAKLLLESGADVDAEADVYGGGSTTLGLAATSLHPELAGVQEALLQLLLDHGARIEKPNLAGNGQGAIIACLANGRRRAAVFLAARGASLNLESASGVGRLDVVKTHFRTDGTLIPPVTKRELQAGFLWACMYGYEDVAAFLLEHGAELRNAADTGASGLHWAAGGGHVGIIKRLLDFGSPDLGSPLEETNRWGGTVLEHAGYGFEHEVSEVDFIPTFEALLAAGAKIRGPWLEWIGKLKNRSLAERARAVEVFRRYGAKA
jgi:ankyrin repeat protein